MAQDLMDSVLEFTPKKTKLKVGVLIQARMTSVRFPGKMMAILKGKPVLQHVIEHSLKIRPVDLVAIIVPDTPASEPMIELADSLGVTNFCGDELNVLKRYYDASHFFNLDVIVRITGDCPFINASVCSEVLQLLLWRKLDYASNVYPERTYPKGLDCEVFTMDALEAAHSLSDAVRPGDWEHVTPWMQRTVGLTRACVRQNVDASRLKYCVDTPEDLIRLEKASLMVTVNDNRKA